MDTTTPNTSPQASPPPPGASVSSPSASAFPASARRPGTVEAQRVVAESAARVRNERERMPAETSGLAVPPLPAPAAAAPATEDQRELRERAAKCWKNAGVPVRYMAADFSKLTDEVKANRAMDGTTYGDVVAHLMGLIESPGMIALLGTRGTGKTWMACALVREFARLGRFAMYRDAMDYFLDLKASYDAGAKVDQLQVEARYIIPKLLVLDEVHERGDTAWEDRMLTRLINKRYAANLSTVLISNQDGDAFEERVGASIADRIKDGGGMIVCDWESLRGRV